MNKEALKKSLEKSEFISDPETMEALLIESDKHLAAAFPGKQVSPQAVVGMAQLILYYEDGVDLPEEEPQE